ncbi:2-amino-4-hydroxy-6-hydroxymethyldihydropteridine diphosphokinase [Roseobacter sp.]|uniref:2-amino-4-hydroxy-6- hydroxymethyldihydropteridine diphosphokinase n=1 Tax=Roseobacter sp. TaxID=1907202 RepID=UPI00329692AB
MLQESDTPQSGEKPPQIRAIAWVALGSNRTGGHGTPLEAVKKGIAAIAQTVGVIRCESPLYRTPAFPPGNGADYVNGVVGVETTMTPQAVITALHDVEARMGRTRKKRWAARTLDLDLIGLGDVVLPDAATHARWRGLSLEDQMRIAPETLILPHPRVQDRAFVLVPFADVAPGWVHPVLGVSVRQMVQALPPESLAEVQRLEDGPA